MKKTTFVFLILFCALILAACAGNTTTATETETVTIQPTLEPTQTKEPPTATLTATSTRTPTETPEPLPTETPGSEAPSVDTALSSGAISFAEQIQPIFNKSCISCHGIKAIKEGLDLRTFDGLLAGSLNGSVITPGDAENSFFIQQIVSGEMPWRRKAPEVTPEELQILIDWVNQGALNN